MPSYKNILLNVTLIYDLSNWRISFSFKFLLAFTITLIKRAFCESWVINQFIFVQGTSYIIAHEMLVFFWLFLTYYIFDFTIFVYYNIFLRNHINHWVLDWVIIFNLIKGIISRIIRVQMFSFQCRLYCPPNLVSCCLILRFRSFMMFVLGNTYILFQAIDIYMEIWRFSIFLYQYILTSTWCIINL